MAGKFNLYQQTVVLSIWANSLANDKGGDFQGDVDQQIAELKKILSDPSTGLLNQKATKAAMGTWTVVWGPAVYEKKPSPKGYADNAIYVVTNEDKSVYVVAIAGTNKKSTYGWFQEDFDVQNVERWDSAFSLDGQTFPTDKLRTLCISAGTHSGVKILLNMKDPVTQKRLDEYLATTSAGLGKHTTLIFTGHSLAGALAPTLALALFDTHGGKIADTKSKWDAVFVLPSAGATPGNQHFADRFSQEFRPTALKPHQPPTPEGLSWKWNQDVWNSLDIVPHAWVIDMLNEIPTLYPEAPWVAGDAPTPPQLVKARDEGIRRSNKGAEKPILPPHAGPYTQLSNNKVTGTYKTGPCPKPDGQGEDGSDPMYDVTDFRSFMRQALYQHTVGYALLFGVYDLIQQLSDPAGLLRIGGAVEGLFEVLDTPTA